MARGAEGVAVGTIWDPDGGAALLRGGGGGGDPAPLRREVGALDRRAGGRDGRGACGWCRGRRCGSARAWCRSATRRGCGSSGTGIEVILNTVRAQSFDPSLFTAVGIDPLAQRILVIKSTNHFHAAFAPIAVGGDLLLGRAALSERSGAHGLRQGAAGHLADLRRSLRGRRAREGGGMSFPWPEAGTRHRGPADADAGDRRGPAGEEHRAGARLPRRARDGLPAAHQDAQDPGGRAGAARRRGGGDQLPEGHRGGGLRGRGLRGHPRHLQHPRAGEARAARRAQRARPAPRGHRRQRGDGARATRRRSRRRGR